MSSIIPVTEQIMCIDLEYQGRPQIIAGYLLHDGHEAALIETGPALTVETLVQGIQAAGVPLESVRKLIVTHIHLDHSGAAGVLVARYPWMKVYVHPRGAPHLADPSKLVASATRLYGDGLNSIWGLPVPVPAENIVVVQDGDEIRAGGAVLRAFDTPGHARHHHAYFDTVSGLIFTGDVGGVRMPGVRYVRPPTPPPDLDIGAWCTSIDRLRPLAATGLAPTHYGVFRGDIEWHWADLQKRLIQWGEWVRRELEQGRTEAEITAGLKAIAAGELQALGIDAAIYDIAGSYDSLVSGYLRYWQKNP